MIELRGYIDEKGNRRFAQWLEGSAGLASVKAGLVTLPMSVVATVSSIVGAVARHPDKALAAP